MDNRILILGNVVSFIGALVMVSIGLLKKKKHILIAQCFMFGILGAGNFILSGITGAAANWVSIIRNLLCLKIKFDTKWKLGFIAVQIIMGLLLGTTGIIAWLPLLAACVFTWFLDTTDEKVLKVIIIIGQILWAAYDISIRNYTSLAFDIFTVISNVIGITMLKKDAKTV